MKYLVNTENTRSQKPQENVLSSGCHYSGGECACGGGGGSGGRERRESPVRQVASSHSKNSRPWVGNVAQRVQHLLASAKPWVPSAAPHKPGGEHSGARGKRIKGPRSFSATQSQPGL